MDENTKMLVEELAGQIGIAAKEMANFIWPILVRQAYIEGIVGIILYVILAISIFAYVKIMIVKVWHNIDTSDWYEDEKKAGIIILGVILAALFIIAILTFSYTISSLVNPEYHALQKILKFVK